jgi:hypothetical protein
MIVVPPISRYRTDYLVVSPSDCGACQFHYINIVAPDGAVGDVTLDGAPLTGFTQLAGTGYSYVQEGVAPGVHSIDTPTTGAPLGVTVYGFGLSDAYGYAGGQPNALNRLVIASLTLNPASVAGGVTSIATLTLTGPAHSAGAVVALDSNNPAVALVPVSATIPAGQSSTSFAVTTVHVDTTTTATIRGVLFGSSASAVLTIFGPISGLTVIPNPMYGGTVSQGRVTLSTPSIGSTVVHLASSDTATATVPATVTIPSGQTFANFNVTAKNIAADHSTTIRATLGTGFLETTVQVIAIKFIGFTLSQSTAFEGSAVTGQVNLNGPAPAGGKVVTLTNSNPAAATVPSSVTIPQGSASKTFTVTAKAVTTTQTTTIKATVGAIQISRNLVVVPITIQSFQLSRDTVTGGTTVSGVVQLGAPAPTAGSIVQLSSGYPNAAKPPATVTVPHGATSATFIITTYPVSQTTNVTLTASHATSTATAHLQVVPPEVNAFTVSPNHTRGGNNVTGTVTLTGKAPTGGMLVHFSANPGLASIGADVIVHAGSTSVSFTIHTSAVSSTTPVTLSAVTANVVKTALLTLTP